MNLLFKMRINAYLYRILRHNGANNLFNIALTVYWQHNRLV